MAKTSSAILIFDGDCAFCSSSARILGKITLNKFQIQPYQHLDLKTIGLDRAQCAEAVQFISSTKSSSGHIAIADALIESRSFFLPMGILIKLPVITSLGYLIYGWVSKNRHRLPGGTPACQLPKSAN